MVSTAAAHAHSIDTQAYLGEENADRVAVTPGVLKVDSRGAVGRHNQRERLVEPAVEDARVPAAMRA